MKKLYSSVTGIDRGSVQLFSDFEENGEMWVGKGERERTVTVAFSESFKSVPTVFITLEMLDLHNKTNYRVVTVAENITEAGFDAVFKTWADTRVARAIASWMAIGEARGEDDWDMDYGS